MGGSLCRSFLSIRSTLLNCHDGLGVIVMTYDNFRSRLICISGSLMKQVHDQEFLGHR